jgi:hypothetical protein
LWRFSVYLFGRLTSEHLTDLAADPSVRHVKSKLWKVARQGTCPFKIKPPYTGESVSSDLNKKGRKVMYFWNTKALVIQLQQNSVGEKSLMNYLLASSVVTLVFFYLSMIVPYENGFALMVEAIGTIVVTAVGLNAAFNANGGASGVGFLAKVVSISFPLTIKFFAASMALANVMAAFEGLGATRPQIDWITIFATTALQVIMFWRLAVHVKSTNIHTAEN